MPRYEYDCPKCGSFEVTQKMSDAPLSHHTCGAPAERRISTTAFSLKGSGWYADGYGTKSAGPSASAAPACGAGGCGAGACSMGSDPS